MILVISCALGAAGYAAARWVHAPQWRRFPRRRRRGWAGWALALAAIGIGPALGLPFGYSLALALALCLVSAGFLFVAILPGSWWTMAAGLARVLVRPGRS